MTKKPLRGRKRVSVFLARTPPARDMLSNRALSNAPSRAAPSNAKSSENVAACAMQRGPLTRRQHLLARNRSENERASRLLSLSDDVLGHVCSFLDGRDLARLETVCTHFKHRSWVAVNEASLPEQSAKRKLDAMTLGEMPPGFRYALSLSGRFYRQISRERRRRTRARARARRVLARGFDDANRVSIARKTRSRVRLARVGSSLAPSPLPDASLGFSEDTVRVQVSVRAASPDAARFFFCSFETAQEDEVHAQAVRRRAAGDPADARERDDRHVGPREEGRGIGEEDVPRRGRRAGARPPRAARVFWFFGFLVFWFFGFLVF